MSKRWLINYLLISLIILFTWIGNKYHVDTQAPAQKNTLTPISPADITSIKVETADHSLSLQKQATRWHITQPINWYANNVAAERLSTLASVEPESALPIEQIDLSALGLRIPRAVVTLNDQVIAFGGTNNIGNRRYLMLDPNVYLVSDIHYAFASQGLTGLVDYRLLPPGLDLNSLKLPAMTVSKNGERWLSESDPERDLNDKITALINIWQQRQAASVKPYNTTLNPINRVTAVTAEAQTIEFFVLAIEPEIIIARPDLKLQYHFPRHLYYDLFALKADEEVTQ